MQAWELRIGQEEEPAETWWWPADIEGVCEGVGGFLPDLGCWN